MTTSVRVAATGKDTDLGRALASHRDLALLPLNEAAPSVVLHLAGATSSSRRLDIALREDLASTREAIDAARAANVPLVLVSRLSSIGASKGLITETNPGDALFGGSKVRGADLDVDAEERSLRAQVGTVTADVDSAIATALRRRELDEKMRRAGGPTSGRAFEAALAKSRETALHKAMQRALVDRASLWRFPTGSAFAVRGFTRALAELAAVQAGISLVIVRLPALLVADDATDDATDGATDDQLDDPALCRLLGRVRGGVLRLPFAARTRLEALPLPLCVDAVGTAACAAARPGAHVKNAVAVVHVATSDRNPLHGERLVDLLDLHLRRQRRQDANGDAAAPPLLSPILSVDTQGSLPGALQAPAALVGDGIEAVARLLPVDKISGGQELLAQLRTSTRGVLKRSAQDVALCTAPPFFSDDVRFVQRGLRMLQVRAGIEPSSSTKNAADVAWKDVLLERHLPMLDARARRREEHKARIPVPAWDSLVHLLVEVAQRYKNRTALSVFLPPGDLAPDGSDVVDITYGELEQRARAAALRLEQAGVEAGDRVVLSGLNHPSWGICAFGALLLRATLVPLDPNLDADAVDNIIKKARPRLAIVDKGVRARLGTVLPDPVFDLHLTATTGPGIDADRTLPSSDELASILFTSGTTGDPKGVMLSHGNFCALIGSLLAVFPVGDGDRMLSVLPLHHTFEFSCGFLMPLAAGAHVYTPDAVVGERVLYALKAGRITALVGVPALWQLLERRMKAQAKERGELAESVFSTLLSINKSLGARFGVSAGRLLLRPVHDELGGHLRVLISGGSALPPAVHDMFQGLGLPLAEGYGLTEAAPVLTVAEGVPGAAAGTVGKAIPGIELKIHDVDDKGVGEVWARGGNVMRGYFENDEATASVLQDGWLRTGDLGRIDDDGVLCIVGRSKDVVVTAAGENIYLDDMEKRLEDIPGVTELTLLGLPDPRGGERLALVAVPQAPITDEDAWLKARQSIGARTQKLPTFQRPALIELVEGPLPRTSTRKVKRKDVRKQLEALLRARENEERAAEDAGVVVLSPIRAAIAQVAGVEQGKLLPHTSLPQDLGFDSLMWVELATQLEPLLSSGGKIDPEVLVTKETVAEIEQLVRDGAPAARKTADKDNARSVAVDDEKSSVVMPAIVRTPLRRTLAQAQKSLYDTLFDTAVVGRSFIPANRSCIVVANHTSHLDTGLVKYALGSYGRDLRPLAAKDYFFEGNRAKVAFFENLTNLVPIDRETGSGLAFEQARAVVEAGHVVLIFPEGTRREDGTLGAFKPLVAGLSLVTGVDVLPLHLECCFNALPRGTLVPQARTLVARIGPPLQARELARLTSHLPAVQAARTSAEVIRKAVVALSKSRVLELERARSLDDLDTAIHALPPPDEGLRASKNHAVF